jgi:GTP cyclohydrolase I
MDKDKIKYAISLLLEGLGEDPLRAGLIDTPSRVAKMYEELCQGLKENPEIHFNKTFSVNHNEMVIEKNIEFHSMCEHHLLPFYGVAHIGYIPNGDVAGLSKLARVVETYARRLQIQEQMTNQIAESFMEYLKPKGVVVMIEARHLCMEMRGVKKIGSKTISYATKGVFKEKVELVDRFIQLVKN